MLRAPREEDSRGGLDRERPRDARSSGAASRRPWGRGLCGVGVGHGPLAGLWLRDASCGVKSQAHSAQRLRNWFVEIGFIAPSKNSGPTTPAVAENHQPEHSQEKQGTQRREDTARSHTQLEATPYRASLSTRPPTRTGTPTQHTTAPLLPSSPQWPPLPRPSPRRPPPPSRRG